MMIIAYKIKRQQCDNFNAITCIRGDGHSTCCAACDACFVNDDSMADDNGSDLFRFWFAIVAAAAPFGCSSRLWTFQIVMFVLTFHSKLSYGFISRCTFRSVLYSTFYRTHCRYQYANAMSSTIDAAVAKMTTLAIIANPISNRIDCISDDSDTVIWFWWILHFSNNFYGHPWIPPLLKSSLPLISVVW